MNRTEDWRLSLDRVAREFSRATLESLTDKIRERGEQASMDWSSGHDLLHVFREQASSLELRYQIHLELDAITAIQPTFIATWKDAENEILRRQTIRASTPDNLADKLLRAEPV